MVQAGQAVGTFRPDEPAHEIVRFISICLRGMIYDWCRNRGDSNPEVSITAHMTKLLTLFLPDTAQPAD